ncbi:MAG: hypothetical protein AAF488_06620 [Planctomycetota bacterium]
MFRLVPHALLWIVFCSPWLFGHGPHAPTRPLRLAPEAQFLYDEADRTLPTRAVGSPQHYEPSVASIGDQLWVATLELLPGEGDHVVVEAIGRGKPQRVTSVVGRYSRPTLTRVRDALWLTVERFDPRLERWLLDRWSCTPSEQQPQWKPQPPLQREVSVVQHAVAADEEGAVWIVWQEATAERSDIVGQKIGPDGVASPPETISRPTDAARDVGDWSPAVAIARSGDVYVAWDSHRDSFDVRVRCRTTTGWTEIAELAATPAFEARPSLAPAKDRGVWITWEVGANHWGQPYRGEWTQWNRITDDVGPLHRHRTVRVGHLTLADSVETDRANGTEGKLRRKSRLAWTPIPTPPTPSFDRAENERPRRPDAKRLGVFYERPKLQVATDGTPWLAYRHYYHPQSAAPEPVVHHIESGWRVHVRSLDLHTFTWGPLTDFLPRQRDGAQRLALAAHGGGVALAWSTGRTDRRNDPEPCGVVIGAVTPTPVIERPERPLSPLVDATLVDAVEGYRERGDASAASTLNRATVQFGSPSYTLFRGDLHRHTDLSLCFPFYDGSLQDVYRYAIEVAGLDFLGVTDHARDLDQGDVDSLAWWRTTTMVRRFHRPGQFHPFYAYERSRGETDHNVIALRDDLLRPHTTPHATFWQQLGDDAFMIPHATHAPPSRAINPVTWRKVDNRRRPLVEIFQGFRDANVITDAHEGLARGHHLGFIGSSDHLSTRASFACVWAETADRASIFHALRARRTYGATAALLLVTRIGEHIMGERIVTDQPQTLHVKAASPHRITAVTLVRDGKPVERRGWDEKQFVGQFSLPAVTEKESYFYIHVEGDDGLEGWASPIWIRPE